MLPVLHVSTRALSAEEASGLLSGPGSAGVDVWVVEALPVEGATCWIREGEGLIGSGIAARFTAVGSERFAAAAAWWREVVGTATVADPVRCPGSGLVAFGSFGFSDLSEVESVLTVPARIFGRRGDLAWETTITVVSDGTGDTVVSDGTGDTVVSDGTGDTVVSDGTDTPEQVAADPAAPSGAVPVPVPAFGPGTSSVPEAQWTAAVAQATDQIRAGELSKVVLARDLLVEADAALDVRTPLTFLARHYPMCWTFHVEGLFGATPELLVRRDAGRVISRVLAGTIRCTGDAVRDDALAAELLASAKDREEHQYAVDSVVEAFAPFCESITAPLEPFVLRLPNVMHLATDVTAEVRPGATSLELAAALHPSAAVGGTPRKAAVELIEEIEGMDRGRYAAPVGWMDAGGDGEWGIALRSAQITGSQVRLFAGCGIVGSSVPSEELAESQAKMVPVKAALGLI